MFESLRLRVPSVLAIVWALLASSVVQAQSSVESGAKIARDVPFVADIKTPAPAPVNIERASLLSTIPERPADLQPAIANGLDSRKSPRAEPRASPARFERVHVVEHEGGAIWARGRD